MDNEISASVWPITLKEINARNLQGLATSGQVEFSGLSPVTVTGFIAFRLIVESDSITVKKQFVLNLPLEGHLFNREPLLNTLVESGYGISKNLYERTLKIAGETAK